jgi:hypothetical protein
MKARIDRCNYISLKGFCTSKNPSTKQREATEWEKIFASNSSG